MNNALDYLQDLHVSPMGAWLLVGYVVFIGGAFGSFLNVVAYRLPLGMSLSRPGSRCPRCEHPIRWFHNVPVVGWLVLRGRCYDCGAPIAARYPLVEFLVALASAVVCWTAIEPTVAEGNVEYSVDLLAVGLRLSLVYVLFCVALLEFDGNPLPSKLCLFALLLGLIGVWLVPQLRPSQHLADSEIPALAELDYPLLAALLLGLLSWPLFFLTTTATLRDASARVFSLLLVGLVLGGLALLIAAVVAGGIVATSIGLANFWPPARRLGWATSLLVATLAWMFIAGSFIGSNDPVVWGDTFYFDDRWQALAIAGVIVAIESALGRAIQAAGTHRFRSLTSEN